MTKEQIHQIAYGFLREACEALGMDVNAAQVRFEMLPEVPVEFLPEGAIPKEMAGGLVKGKGIPMTILPIPGGVVVNERMLEQTLGKESSTPVRMMMCLLQAARLRNRRCLLRQWRWSRVYSQVIMLR